MSVETAVSALFGRESEVAALTAALDEVAEGEPTAVVIRGEAGIGKSRLVAELRQMARVRGVPVLVGHCLNLETALAFAPVVEVLDDLLGLTTPIELLERLGPGTTGELARLVPELRGLVDAPGTADRLALFTAVRDALGMSAPLLLVIEDLQWSDASTRDLVSFVARGRPAPVGVVVTVRDTDLAAPVAGWLAEFARGVAARQLWLGGLSHAEVARLSAALTGRRPDRASVDRLMERTGGNPFLVEEVTSSDESGHGLSVALHDLLRRRLDGLSADARGLVEAAALGGLQRVDGALLTSVAGIDPAGVPGLYRALVDRAVLRAVGDTYVFRHGLLAEAVAADLVPEQRRALHAAWARALERVDRGDAATLAALAHHWEQSGDAASAARAALAAAPAATREFAHAEAAGEYARALRLCPERVLPDGQDRTAVLRSAAMEAARAGRHDDAVVHVQEALDLVDASNDPCAAGLLHDLLGEFQMAAGREEAFLAAKQRALELMPVDPPSVDAAFLLARAAHSYFINDRVDTARTLADDAVAMARRLDDVGPLARALAERAAILAGLGELDDARGDLEEAERLVARVPLEPDGRDTASHAERDLMVPAVNLLVLLAAGQYGELMRQAQALVEAAALCGAQGETEFARQMITVAAIRGGDWERARSTLERMEDDDHGGGHMRRHRACLHLELAVATGDDDRVRMLLEELGQAPPSDLLQRHDVARLHAEFALWQHRPREALVVCADALRAPVHPGAEPMTAGVLATALRAHAELSAEADAGVDVPAPDVLLTRLDDATTGRGPEAMAYRATGRAELSRLRTPDPAPWEDAARRWSELGVSYRAAYCQYRQAEALLHTVPDHAAAAQLLRQAADTCHRLGAQPLLDEIAALARRARTPLDEPTASTAPVPSSSRAPTLGLTPRELDVMDLLAVGATNAQIARALFVTEKTVEGHVSNVLRKLRAANRVEAASRYHQARATVEQGE